ncbi:MAG: hypothetical protein HYW22_00485 [Candidatus Aenigmarchaeota archaeon]|nr:hypothetical protein [Candidatus Aenigmarchaeota archaeon]
MITTPVQAARSYQGLRQLSDEELSSVDWQIGRINEVIGRYDVEHKEVHFLLHYGTSRRVAYEVARRYREAGWEDAHIERDTYGLFSVMSTESLVIGYGEIEKVIDLV